ncbi:nucleoside deaminase [Wenzhouxiangella sp. AB-CW3]|uniref:nucleoside deaminase n=1 Tax=Wenzhouxiangella sp. AB-CW3 TaxID=2771012 RepID=UPI00168A52C2|nr:nucleoside deaminase [Wenzhouxiangella sp. AB-CW3]QOC23966.1 nucleoside deaminase [Wenzhouxiangella sp. AB-CW3]
MMSKADNNSVRIDLPDWIAGVEQQLPASLETAEQRMSVAISLAEQNLRHGTGGPFGALVVAVGSGAVIALGVNRVEPQLCSAAHAEIVALSLAQRRMGHWNLSETPHGPLQLVTSCEPCAMCLGAIPWSGVTSVLCGATKADAEAAGFDEGARSSRWVEELDRRGVDVRTGVLREQAARVLERYARQGNTIYNP